MKKKAIFTIFVLFLCLLVIGCVTNIKETNDSLDLQEDNDSLGLPGFSAYQNLTESERTIIIDKLDAIPMDDVVKHFEKKIADYTNNQELIDIISLDIYKDHLLMHGNMNQKMFENLFINVELSFYTKDMTWEERESKTKKMNDEIIDLCNIQDTYGFLKLNSLHTIFIDTNNRYNFKYSNGVTQVSPITNIKQTIEELETQNIVYNFVNEHDNYLLKRFGIIDETKELYIEIPIYDRLYGMYHVDEEEQSNILENLNGISDSLYNKILSNTLSKQYIQSNDVNVITISFFVPWNKEEFITYNYKLE